MENNKLIIKNNNKILFGNGILKIKNKVIRNYLTEFLTLKNLIIRTLIYLLIIAVSSILFFILREQSLLNNWDNIILNKGMAWNMGDKWDQWIVYFMKILPLILMYFISLGFNKKMLYIPFFLISYNSLLNVIDKGMVDYYMGIYHHDTVVDYIYWPLFNFTNNVADIMIISGFGFVVFAILKEISNIIKEDVENDKFTKEVYEMFEPIIIKEKIERLDKFLVSELGISRSKITNMITDGKVFINSEIAHKPGQELNIDDVITYQDNNVNEDKSLIPYEFNLDIHYEDDDLLIVYKPSGMLTHQTQFNENNTLMNALHYYSKGKFETLLIHRLDKDTSGLLIFAKNEKAQKLLLDMTQNREIIKRYYAIVNGKMKKDKAIINVPICRANDNRLKMVAGEGKNPKEALTEYETIKTWEHYSLLNIRLHTGRTHQIRVHLRYINHPIVNDPLYSFNNYESDYHQYLMAYSLEFIHP
ncbi:MAG: RluA family pseudouridine synthase, partial [Mycoplasma sp.]